MSHDALRTLHVTHYKLHVARCTLHNTRYTLHVARYTLHNTRYTLLLHITRYTLHLARCTLARCTSAAAAVQLRCVNFSIASLRIGPFASPSRVSNCDVPVTLQSLSDESKVVVSALPPCVVTSPCIWLSSSRTLSRPGAFSSPAEECFLPLPAEDFLLLTAVGMERETEHVNAHGIAGATEGGISVERPDRSPNHSLGCCQPSSWHLHECQSVRQHLHSLLERLRASDQSPTHPEMRSRIRWQIGQPGA